LSELTEFQDAVIARRVVGRFLEAGIFEAPPAMHEEILEWALAVVAAKEIAGLKVGLDDRHEDSSTYKHLMEGLNQAKEFQKTPVWKVYKELHPMLWFLGGHPGGRKSIREFQKMTPEKQQKLQDMADAYVGMFEKSIKGDEAHFKHNRDEWRKEMALLKKYVRPGVKPVAEGDSVTKKFKINTKGWRYGEKELERRVQVIIEKQQQETRDTIEFMQERLDEGKAKPGKEDQLKEVIERLQKDMKEGKGWDEITVELTTKSIKGARAYWQEGSRLLLIVLPYNAQPYQLDDLSRTLRHELQHFGQSYLAYTIGIEPWERHKRHKTPGFPSRKIQTPEYRQHYGPEHPGFQKDNPEVKQLQRRLRDQGLSLRQIDLHALDDVEFYTRLADAIDAFNKNVKYAERDAEQHRKNYKEWGEENVRKPLDMNMAIKFFTGAVKMPYTLDNDFQEKMKPYGGGVRMSHFTTSRFFSALKSHAPGKWRKAVSELVKAVT